MKLREEIGAQIKAIRESKGMTQKELADKTGMIQTTISKIESGKFGYSLDIIEKVIIPLKAKLKIEVVE